MPCGCRWTWWRWWGRFIAARASCSTASWASPPLSTASSWATRSSQPPKASGECDDTPSPLSRQSRTPSPLRHLPQADTYRQLASSLLSSAALRSETQRSNAADFGPAATSARKPRTWISHWLKPQRACHHYDCLLVVPGPAQRPSAPAKSIDGSRAERRTTQAAHAADAQWRGGGLFGHGGLLRLRPHRRLRRQDLRHLRAAVHTPAVQLRANHRHRLHRVRAPSISSHAHTPRTRSLYPRPPSSLARAALAHRRRSDATG